MARVMHKRPGSPSLAWTNYGVWFRTVCGRPSVHRRYTALHWRKVTCKHCLKRKPKR